MAPALHEVYRQYFDTIAVQQEDRALRDEVFRLRYQVYCVENPFADPAAHPDGLAHDVYDERATHCLLFPKRTARWVRAGRQLLRRPEDECPGRQSDGAENQRERREEFGGSRYTR